MEGRDLNRREEKIFRMANTEALISAVESRCICAIERAPGGAGWFGFQQALHGILGTLFWGKTLRATKIPQLIFWRRRSASAQCAFAGRAEREETVVIVWRPSSSFPAASIPVVITAHALGLLCRIHNPQFLPSGGFKKPDFLGVSKQGTRSNP